jgi:hypothetical protein
MARELERSFLTAGIGGRPFRFSAGLLFVVLLLSLIANFDACRGYFEDDDLATLTWARSLPLKDLIWNIPTLKYPPEHSRPIGFLFYDAIARRADLEYPPYVIGLTLVHILNVALLWLLLRKLGLDARASAIGCAFFALHRALFDAWWKPMFIYDVSCTTFSLLAILAYAGRRWILSAISFWLAVRSKEVGIVLPAVLVCYEMLLGDRNWKRTLPFFLPAAFYGVNGLVYNLHQSSNYTMRIGLADLWKSASFYAAKVFQIRYAGFLLLLAPFFIRDRRVYFGLAASLLALSIYLLLPGRLFEIYLYLPMVGVSIVVAVLAARYPRVVAALALVWFTWNVALVRRQAHNTLDDARERRAYVMAVRQVADTPVYLYDRIPASMHSWGVDGALRLYHSGIVAVHRLEDSNPPAQDPAQLLNWDPGSRKLTAIPFSLADAARVRMDREAPAWQLGTGWSQVEDGRRGIKGRATARLYRPEGTVEFEWQACAAEPAELRTIVDGEEMPRITLDHPGCVKRHARVRPRAAGVVGVDFVPSAGAVAIGDFGFEH